MANRSARGAFLAAYRAALRSVDPCLVTERHLSGLGERLEVGGQTVEIKRGVRILAVGKAAHGMARGAVSLLSFRLVGGLIISDQHRPSPHPRLRVMVGDHPYPGRASLLAGRAALALAGEGHPDELLLALVSGGGSSLMEVPAPGITFDDLAAAGRALVTGGVPISEMNVVRRHLSSIKNGGIARRAGGRPLATLMISDVVDGPASAVASGPTLADGTTPEDARTVLADYRLEKRMPPSVMAYLESSRSVARPSIRRPYQVMADGKEAARAARVELGARGFSAETPAAPVVGEAGAAAREAMEKAGAGRVQVYWGETTVRIDAPSPGRGGRNQHAALVAAGRLAERGRGVFGGFATDGVDGESDAAGGLVDSGTIERGRAVGLDWREYLRRYDSSSYLASTGDLVVTGPTGVNVGDLWLVAG
ncbi:MAG: DUF4147 domain-containing protein [bacterium]|nr:DUF4147 domain-containing protein [bacterium]MDE0600381.1 DUF4147 domain-containing protein [bacterium]